ncbi:MAG: RagB/SusD family nutrient uptake outer membrane protein [Bacteroidales bacterium]|nr:RagB/SusD family nutrient uptake outer membrane protein [Bacteroidales bacterium]
MKKSFIILFAVCTMIFGGCSKEYLNTQPTDMLSPEQVYQSSANALSVLDGVYRMLTKTGWGSSWAHENAGYSAYTLVFDLYGEDHVMDNQGSGWFYYDYAFNTWGDYTSTAGHQYQIWNFFYKVINNTNNVLAHTFTDDEETANSVLGQAYALRALSYMWLVQSYCQPGPDFPGVPIYTEPTTPESEGKGRGKVQDVYNQVNSDMNKAIEYLEKAAKAVNKTHIDIYTAYGFKARFAMVQKDYETAYTFAKKAMANNEISQFKDIKNVNDISAKDVMWGFSVQTDQATGGAVYTHMDADSKTTYSKARHLIGSWLYDQIPETDARLGWWTAPLPEKEWGTPGTEEGSRRSYCQTKLVYKSAAASTGDYIYMRVEEMYLIAAEAACHMQNYADARYYIKQLGNMRDTNYEERLESFPDSKEINPNTTDEIITLMDEILFQRRVELWGEMPRQQDLQRLGLGFDRDWESPESNHTEKLEWLEIRPGSPALILWIPDKEFDNNKALDRKVDQNPDQES